MRKIARVEVVEQFCHINLVKWNIVQDVALLQYNWIFTIYQLTIYKLELIGIYTYTCIYIYGMIVYGTLRHIKNNKRGHMSRLLVLYAIMTHIFMIY